MRHVATTVSTAQTSLSYGHGHTYGQKSSSLFTIPVDPKMFSLLEYSNNTFICPFGIDDGKWEAQQKCKSSYSSSGYEGPKTNSSRSSCYSASLNVSLGVTLPRGIHTFVSRGTRPAQLRVQNETGTMTATSRTPGRTGRDPMQWSEIDPPTFGTSNSTLVSNDFNYFGSNMYFKPFGYTIQKNYNFVMSYRLQDEHSSAATLAAATAATAAVSQGIFSSTPGDYFCATARRWPRSTGHTLCCTTHAQSVYCCAYGCTHCACEDFGLPTYYGALEIHP